MRPWSAFVGALILVLVAAISLALWQAREAFLLAFGSAVAATLLLAIAWPIEGWTGLGRAWSLPLSGFILAVAFAVFLFGMGSQLSPQISELQQRLPTSLDAAEQRLMKVLGIRMPWLEPNGQNAAGDAERMQPPSEPFTGSGLLDFRQLLTGALGSLASFGSALFGSLVSLVIVLVGAFFLASDPAKYKRGIMLLFPKGKQDLVGDAMEAVGLSLHRWLIAQLISMALVGAMVGTGAWLIGLPAPLALGFFAGLAEFVPAVGPYIGAAPALVIAASNGLDTLLWTVGLFIIVQQIESNFVTPLVQQSMTDVPAFLMLFSIVAMGLVFGIVGVIIAAPLTVAIHTLVGKLYVEAALGNDPDDTQRD